MNGAEPQPPEPANPGPPEPADPADLPLQITDPLALRALAHPARIAIAQHLALDGPATATECARFTGLSPSACSYHLRTLARYGFIEADPAGAADSRNRPWRARAVQMTVSEADQDPAMRAASRFLTEQVLAHVGALRAQYLRQEDRYPAAWRNAAHLNQAAVHVTPDELAELRARLLELLAPLHRTDPATRPPQAGRVHVLLDLIPWFAPDDEPSLPPEVPVEQAAPRP